MTSTSASLAYTTASPKTLQSFSSDWGISQLALVFTSRVARAGAAGEEHMMRSKVRSKVSRP